VKKDRLGDGPGRRGAGGSVQGGESGVGALRAAVGFAALTTTLQGGTISGIS